MLLLELRGHVIDDPIIPIFAAQAHVSFDGQRLKAQEQRPAGAKGHHGQHAAVGRLSRSEGVGLDQLEAVGLRLADGRGPVDPNMLSANSSLVNLGLELMGARTIQRIGAEIDARGHLAPKAVAFKEALTPEFKVYQQQILLNAKALSAGLLTCGFRLVSGGTDNHLMLMDLRETELTGKVAQETLDKARITVNKNAIPFDTRSPFVTSGVRIGTPAVTSRGMKEPEMAVIADLISRVLQKVGDEKALAAIGDDVRDLCRRFPLAR